MIHGHELREVYWLEGWYRVEGSKGEKKWDNYDSIIDKIYFKEKNGFHGTLGNFFRSTSRIKEILRKWVLAPCLHSSKAAIIFFYRSLTLFKISFEEKIHWEINQPTEHHHHHHHQQILKLPKLSLRSLLMLTG